jgi:serine/threonine protein kinase
LGKLRRRRNELRDVARRHPNILTFYGTLNGPTPMTLLEYMPSGSLKAGLQALNAQKRGQVPLHTLANIALQVARGMDYLHKVRASEL